MMRFVLLTGLFVALPNVAFGGEAQAPPARPHEVSGGVATSFFIRNFDVTPTAWTLDLAYHYRPQRPGFWQTLRFTGGLRAGLTDNKEGVFEVYGRGEMIANIGPWTPTLGPELGVSTLGRHFARIQSSFPDDLTNLNEMKLSPFYISLVANPIRFCFSRFTVSAFELSLGAPVNGIGTVARFQLGILHLGGTL
jgi:hypothetical protein